jgi:hypothetical protein
MTRLDECLPDVISEDLSAGTPPVPKVPRRKGHAFRGDDAAADNEIHPPQDEDL